MKIFLYEDDSLSLNLSDIATSLTTITEGQIEVHKREIPFQIKGTSIRYPQSYENLPSNLLAEVKDTDYAICFTKYPYDNNYFFHSSHNIVIVSFYAWEILTQLPMDNGVIYFVASLAKHHLPLPTAHKEITGCINDFLWDKAGIDVCMKSGNLCDICRKHLAKRKLEPEKMQIMIAINKILQGLGAASRNNENIIDYWKRGSLARVTNTSDKFAVFLCHNSKDKVEVRRIDSLLKSHGVRTWIDEEQLRPGLAWQVALEEQIINIETAAVFVGHSGVGPWQNMEIRAFLSEFVNRRCPVIPVILPDAEIIPELPVFLRQMTWVDFREDYDIAMKRLVWGITGKRL